MNAACFHLAGCQAITFVVTSFFDVGISVGMWMQLTAVEFGIQVRLTPAFVA